MPGTSAPTQDFILQTLFDEGGNSYVIDQLTQPNLLKATPGSINSASIIPRSYLTNDLTTYKIAFTPTHDIS